MYFVYYIAKCIEVPVIINLDDLPTRRLFGDVLAATPVGTLPASIVVVIKLDIPRPFLRFIIEAVVIFLLFDIPASCTRAKSKIKLKKKMSPIENESVKYDLNNAQT